MRVFSCIYTYLCAFYMLLFVCVYVCSRYVWICVSVIVCV